MKKLLVLMLVLGMASMAAATVTYEFRDAAGTTPITSIDVAVGNYTFFVMGAVADAGWKEGVYATDQNPGGGLHDMTAATSYPAAGDAASIIDYISSFDGVDLYADDLSTALPDIATGDWFKLSFSLDASAVDGDTVYVDILDYMANYTLVSTHGLPVVPEPMTIALLGLGGLFLLRRRR